jgi:hypothetical protein
MEKDLVQIFCSKAAFTCCMSIKVYRIHSEIPNPGNSEYVNPSGNVTADFELSKRTLQGLDSDGRGSTLKLSDARNKPYRVVNILSERLCY